MKLRVLALAIAAATLSSFLVACGGENTTTVIKEAAPETVEKTVTEQVQAPEPKPKPAKAEPEPENVKPTDPPNTVGLPLPDAEALLKEAGFKPAVKNTDTAFGIINPNNYTICTQGKPRGNLVPVLAQKYGC
jgi:hypothetical protein